MIKSKLLLEFDLFALTVEFLLLFVSVVIIVACLKQCFYLLYSEQVVKTKGRRREGGLAAEIFS